tara:strand:+ start:4460 stop:4630 length:171 start_codon:yes stop_codon:yes gene_type:complete
MDIFGDELVVRFAPPQSMYLPEGSHNEHIQHRFKLLGDSSAAQTGITSRVEEALYA